MLFTVTHPLFDVWKRELIHRTFRLKGLQKWERKIDLMLGTKSVRMNCEITIKLKETPLINNILSWKSRERERNEQFRGMFMTVKRTQESELFHFIPLLMVCFFAFLFPLFPLFTSLHFTSWTSRSEIHKSLNQKHKEYNNVASRETTSTVTVCYSSSSKKKMSSFETIMRIMSSCNNENRAVYAGSKAELHQAVIYTLLDIIKNGRKRESRKTIFLFVPLILFLVISLLQSQNHYINTCEHNRATNQDRE